MIEYILKPVRLLVEKISLPANIRSFLTGTSLLSATNILSALLGFVVTATVARNYGATATGILASISSFIILFAIAGNCGTDVLVVREAARARERVSFFQVVRRLQLISSCGAILIIVIVGLVLSLDYVKARFDLSQHVVVIMLGIFSLVIHRVNGGAIRASGDVVKYSMMGLVQVVVLFITSQFAILAGYNEDGLVVLYFLPYPIMMLLSWFLLRRIVTSYPLASQNVGKAGSQEEFSVLGSVMTLKTLFLSGLPMMGTAFGYVIFTTADILILSFFEPSSEVGIYSIYVRLVSVVIIASSSANAMLAPTFSRLYAENDFARLRRYVKSATLITFVAVLLPSLLLVTFAESIMAFFGEEFVETPYSLYVLLFGYTVSVCFGSVGYFLNMTNREGIFMKISLLTAAINVLLNLIFVPMFGIVGAAIASAISILWKAIAATVYIKRKYGYTLIFF